MGARNAKDLTTAEREILALFSTAKDDSKLFVLKMLTVGATRGEDYWQTVCELAEGGQMEKLKEYVEGCAL